MNLADRLQQARHMSSAGLIAAAEGCTDWHCADHGAYVHILCERHNTPWAEAFKTGGMEP